MKLKFGVPCSRIMKHLHDVELNCTSEEQALGIAAGCILAGKNPEVYMQNSGLGRCVDILTSLYMPYKIPYPKLLLSVRHWPHHHSFIGERTHDLLMMLDYKNVEIVEEEK